MWLVVLLFAFSGGAATPDQHQDSASALYRVLTVYDAYGTFERSNDGALQRETHVSGSLTLGSSFAITYDGWLVTARHVVDPHGKLTELCEHLRSDWTAGVAMRSLRLVTLFEDIAGNGYGSIVIMAPKDEATASLCGSEISYDIFPDESSTARIVALDSLADLALIKLDVPKTRFLSLAPTVPERWADAFVVGYSEVGQRMTVSGVVAIRCEEIAGLCSNPRDDGTEACPLVQVMRTTAPVLEGMSGSAQIVNGRAVGVTTMKSVNLPVGFAVPSTYTLRWYRHVRWPKKYPRPSVVCVPTPEP